MTAEQRIAEFLAGEGIRTESTRDFVEHVSNIYHGFEASTYDDSHGEINLATPYWQQALEVIVPQLPQQISVLDIGCGTGFASHQVLQKLHQRVQMLVCQDLSPKMVGLCRDKLKNEIDHGYYVSGEIASLLGGRQQFDLVVTNALLHHILDIPSFLRVLRQFVSPGGFYVAGHEPGASFYTNEVLRQWMQRYRLWKRSRRLWSPSFYKRRLGIKPSSPNLEQMTNQVLIEQKRLTKPLPAGAISRLVDIHVPPFDPQAPFWGERGFDPVTLCADYLEGFSLKVVITYSHIKDAGVQGSPFWRQIDRRLAHRYPESGADLIFVAQRVQ